MIVRARESHWAPWWPSTRATATCWRWSRSPVLRPQRLRGRHRLSRPGSGSDGATSGARSTNRALRASTRPGSTYKAIVAAAGLEEGIIDPDEPVYCPGPTRLGRRTYRCWKREGHGNGEHAPGAQAILRRVLLPGRALRPRASTASPSSRARFGLGRPPRSRPLGQEMPGVWCRPARGRSAASRSRG